MLNDSFGLSACQSSLWLSVVFTHVNSKMSQYSEASGINDKTELAAWTLSVWICLLQAKDSSDQ